MSITATCAACGRKFIAPAQFQGKRVKCKGCGQVFVVPSAASSASSNGNGSDTEADALSQLAAVATVSAPVSDRITSDPISGFESPAEAAEEATRKLTKGFEPNVLTFNYPGADDVDQWLAPALIVIGILVLLAGASSGDNKGAAWITFTRFFTPVMLYSALAFPITLGMLRKASRKLKYGMPPNFVQRGFAVYLPAFALVVWTSGEGFTITQLFAGILGLIVSSCLLWLLFRLREEHIGTMAVFGAAGFAISAALIISITLGLNRIAWLMVASDHAEASVPVSPFGENLSWVQPPPAPVVAPEPPPAKPVPAVVSSTAPPAPLAGLIGSFDPGGIPPLVEEVLDPMSSSPFVGIVRRQQSAVSVECWNTQTWKPQAGTLKLPGMPGGNMVISTDGEKLAWIADFPHLSIQIWSFTSGRVVSSVNLDRLLGHPELVGFIGPDLLLIDRTGRKNHRDPSDQPPASPKPDAPAKPAPTPKPHKPNIFDMDADQPDDAPQAGAANPAAPTKPAAPSVPVIQLSHEFSTIDITTGNTVASFTVPALVPDRDSSAPASAFAAASAPLRYGRNFAVSVAAQRMVAAIDTIEKPTLIQIDLNTGKLLPPITVAEMEPGMGTSVTGLSYSNDGQSLAALYESAGSAQLLTYSTDSGAETSSLFFPAGPLEGQPHDPFRSSSICWLDPAPFLLVYGRGVVSTRVALHFKEADLSLENVVNQRYTDGDRIELVTNTAKVSVLRLDREKMETTLTAPSTRP
jgi:hypothetical protein